MHIYIYIYCTYICHYMCMYIYSRMVGHYADSFMYAADARLQTSKRSDLSTRQADDYLHLKKTINTCRHILEDTLHMQRSHPVLRAASPQRRKNIHVCREPLRRHAQHTRKQVTMSSQVPQYRLTEFNYKNVRSLQSFPHTHTHTHTPMPLRNSRSHAGICWIAFPTIPGASKAQKSATTEARTTLRCFSVFGFLESPENPAIS